ncbi:lipopolysaccharide biosynthesis protein [Pedobacter frigoris]|uniref:exopolysaccharide transport family protein n=1 Tax=Pedobacter frigoris TaxID=2571272 RepID=UPI00292FD4D5|nr:lipopolysaccharide biosynthesis protein [Pedobacter frigoris]
MIVPVITVIITYFLVRNLKSSYVSQAQISTGIVDETPQQSAIIQTIQGEQVRQQFSNLMEMIKMNKVLYQVSYLLMIHDLTSTSPLKRPSKLLSTLNQDARSHAISVYKSKYASNLELNSAIPDEKGLYAVLSSMDYHPDGLKGKIGVFRSGESDFITIQFEAETPELSAFVVNTLAAEFIKNYTSTVKKNKLRANDFLRNLLREKTDTLANRMAELKNYKIKNKVLNLSEQSKQLYSLIVEYDTKKQEAIEKTASYAGALNEIDAKFDPKERNYIESKISTVNQSIIESKQELSDLYNLYLENDLDESYKKRYDSLSRKLTEQINKSSDQYITNPLNTKQALINEKINLEIQMDISRYSISSLEDKINTLTRQFSGLVPQEAEVQTLEMNIDIASKEYLDILAKYNQNSLEAGFNSKMNLVQEGTAGLVQPSKKFLLVIISAIVSFSFCLMTLFLIFIGDSRIVDSIDLTKKTELPVLGSINKLINKSVDLLGLWTLDLKDEQLIEFRNQLRSLRYEIENNLVDKILLVNSLHSGDGKTFLSMSLAFAWKMTNLRVLLIDGNFFNPHISKLSPIGVYLEDFLQDKENLVSPVAPGIMTILKNRGGDTSLMEMASYDKIKSKLEWAKENYDIIIIESGALKEVTQAKEWLSFVQDFITVYKSGTSISESDKKYISLLREQSSFKGWVLNMFNNTNNQ